MTVGSEIFLITVGLGIMFYLIFKGISEIAEVEREED